MRRKSSFLIRLTLLVSFVYSIVRLTETYGHCSRRSRTATVAHSQEILKNRRFHHLRE